MIGVPRVWLCACVLFGNSSLFDEEELPLSEAGLRERLFSGLVVHHFAGPVLRQQELVCRILLAGQKVEHLEGIQMQPPKDYGGVGRGIEVRGHKQHAMRSRTEEEEGSSRAATRQRGFAKIWTPNQDPREAIQSPVNSGRSLRLASGALWKGGYGIQI